MKGALVIFVWTLWINVECASFSGNEESRATLPSADGRLHLYVLPVGQGDAHVIQCPDGDLTLVDLGTTDGAGAGFWRAEHILEWLDGQEGNIRNIVITHQHYDHYRLLPEAFTEPSMLSGLNSIFISCTGDDVAWRVEDWFDDLELWNNVVLFNDGAPCGPNGVDCGNIQLCSNSPGVQAKVMASNMGQHCSDGGNINIDSIVIKISYGDVSILLSGDFEDRTTNWEEDGPQKAMVDHYGSELISTVYQLSHHGADRLANKPVIRDAVMPKAIFASNNPWYSYNHPRCSVIDAFINYVQSLCKPGETDESSEFYCGPVLDDGNPPSIQDTYTCGDSDGSYTRPGNDLAIYTTAPEEDTMNLVTFTTDGQAWAFYNNIMARLTT